MSNTSTPDNFERIAEDTMDVLIQAMDALASKDENEQLMARIVLSMQAANICQRAIALTA